MTPAKFAVLAAVFAASIATVATGTPPRLPDIALSSPVLFHLERVAALLATCVVVLVILSRAWSGELPAEVSAQGMRYSDGGLSALQDTIVVLRAEHARMLRRIEALETEAYRADDG